MKRCAAHNSEGKSICKEKLLLSNKHLCQRCKQEVCLSHRHPDEHGCPGRPVGRTDGFLSGLYSGVTAAVSTLTASAPVPAPARSTPAHAAAEPRPRPKPAQQVKPQDLLRETAHRRMQQQQQQAGASAPAAAAPSAGGERCPQCSANFRDLPSLIAHVESSHGQASAPASSSTAQQRGSSGSNGTFIDLTGADNATPYPGAAASTNSSGNGSPRLPQPGPRPDGGSERCPHCGAGYSDVAKLVSHVEAEHPHGSAGPGGGGGGNWVAAAGGGDGGSGCTVS